MKKLKNRAFILGILLSSLAKAQSVEIKGAHTSNAETEFVETPKQKSFDSTYNRSIENCAKDVAQLIACPRRKGGKLQQTSSARWERVHYLKSSLDQCREDILDLRPAEGKAFTMGKANEYLGNRVEALLKDHISEDQRKVLFTHDQLGTLLNNFEEGVHSRLNKNLTDEKSLEINTQKSKKAPLTELLSEGSYQKRWASFWNEYATKKDQEFYKNYKAENCEKGSFSKYEKGKDGKRELDLKAEVEKPEVKRENPSVDAPLKDVQKDVTKLGNEYKTNKVSAGDTVDAMDRYHETFEKQLGGIKLTQVDPKNLEQVKESRAFVDEVLMTTKGNEALLPIAQRRKFEVASLKLKTWEKKGEATALSQSMVEGSKMLTQINERSDLASDQKTLEQIHSIYTKITVVKFNPPQTRVLYRDYKDPVEVQEKLKFVTELQNVNSWALKKAKDAGNQELVALFTKRAEEYENIFNQLNSNPHGKK